MRPSAVLLAAILPLFVPACAGQAGAPSGDDKLLTAADLPAGFQAAEAAAEETDKSDPAACGAAMDDLKTGEDSRAEFTDAGGLARIQEILRHDDGGGARVAAAREAIGQCPSYTLTGSDGTRYAVTTAIVDTTPTGFTATVRRHNTAAGDVFEILVVARVSATVMVLSYAAPEQPDLAAATRLAKTATDRLR